MEPFWSDDFDTDLLKVCPSLIDDLGDDANIELWTVGMPDRRYGNLNHPSTWNTHGAYLWLEKPNLKRDEYGWINLNGCVSNDEEIKCTLLEFLRDKFIHGFNTIVLPSEFKLYNFPWEWFQTIMWDIRGIGEKREVESLKNKANQWAVLRASEIKTLRTAQNSIRSDV